MMHRKSVPAILVMLLGSLLAGCATIQADRFAITPAAIRYSQSFTITLPKVHPAKLSIRTPAGQWYWVQDAEENILLMPAAEFNKTTRITVSPAQLFGTSWINGKKVHGRVFNSAGEYLIYFADNLETEPENTFHFMGTLTIIK